MTKLNIGLKQGRRLCQMSSNERLGFIAEGLPIILESARSFWKASQQLTEMPREAEVLSGNAEEEAAKILIMMDIVRCPPKLLASKLGIMMGYFYHHLARLLYVDAVNWKPMHVSQLQQYMDHSRKAHYVEGYAGEYIFPNWNTYRRESILYADIEGYEDGGLGWSTPTGVENLFSFTPAAIQLVEALSALGVFALNGLRATADIWGQVEFKDSENLQDSHHLTKQLLERLIEEKLPTEAGTQDDVNTIYNVWQMPMYNLELREIDVPLDELEREREALLWSEIGGY
jgi:hypothetical protein